MATNPRDIGLLIGGHWGIENSAHWILDLPFREDAQKARAGHITENLSLIRRVVIGSVSFFVLLLALLLQVKTDSKIRKNSSKLKPFNNRIGSKGWVFFQGQL